MTVRRVVLSALGGTLQMVAGGIMIVIVSASFDGTALPMVTIIALSAVGAFVLARLTLRRGQMSENRDQAEALPQPVKGSVSDI